MKYVEVGLEPDQALLDVSELGHIWKVAEVGRGGEREQTGSSH